jgi:hypothetical protein
VILEVTAFVRAPVEAVPNIKDPAVMVAAF